MAVKINYDLCKKCKTCYTRCPEDVFEWREDKTPVVTYPYECWFCGACYIDCKGGAITMDHPLFMRFVPEPYEYKNKRIIEREY